MPRRQFDAEPIVHNYVASQSCYSSSPVPSMVTLALVVAQLPELSERASASSYSSARVCPCLLCGVFDLVAQSHREATHVALEWPERCILRHDSPLSLRQWRVGRWRASTPCFLDAVRRPRFVFCFIL